MAKRSSTRPPPQQSSPGQRAKPGLWRMPLGPMLFGLVAGVLLTLGIVSLVGAAKGSPSSPVVSSGATANASPVPTATLTLIATPLPTDTPLPTAAPTPVPTEAPAGSSDQLFKPDDPRFYIVAFLVFIIIAGLYLARKR